MNKIYLLIILFLGGYVTVQAQIPNSPTSDLTPNASAIQRYGEIPVSLYTGIPDISIPIYNFEVGKLSMPISLSYHSGGVKPEEHPGWTGMGWTLQAGGAITRKKNDMIDEGDTRSLPEAGYYWKHSMAKWSADASYWNSLLSLMYAYDTEPDEFHFNFNGYSGFFVMDTDGNWQVKCNKPMSIKLNGFLAIPKTGEISNWGQMPPSFSGFTLTDENGIQYVFGGDAIEYAINFNNQLNGTWIANSWFLTKVIHPNGDCIQLEYERGKYINTLNASTSFSMYYIMTKDKGIVSSQVLDGYIGRLEYFGSLLSPVYLKNITTNVSDLSVGFDSSKSQEMTYDMNIYNKIQRQAYEQGIRQCFYYLERTTNDRLEEKMAKLEWRKLDRIVVSDGYSFQLRSVDFTYGNKATERLMLKDIRINNQLDMEEEAYSFKYRNADKLPAYLSTETDHWGFYNNHPTQGDPDTNPDFKNANPAVLLYGSLEEITYPTGGKTRFYFEPHMYSQQMSLYRWQPLETVKTSVAGGIRLKKMEHIPGNGQPNVCKEYLYVSGYTPLCNDTVNSGILGGQPVYMNSNSDGYNFFYAKGSSDALFDCSNSLGYHIGYSEVVEKQQDGGYVIHRFTSPSDSKYRDAKPDFDVALSYDSPVSSRKADRGKPIEDEYYTAEGVLKKKIVIEYERGNSEEYVAAVRCAPVLYATDPIYLATVDGTAYRIFTYSLRETRRTITEYTGNGSSEVCQLVTYNSKNQVTKQVREYTRRGIKSTQQEECEYEWERNRNFRELSLFAYKTKIKKMNTQDLDTCRLNEFLTTYRLEANKLPVIDRVWEYKFNNSTHIHYQCLLNDSKGNPVHVLNLAEENIVYLWKQNGKLLAEIRNATPEEVENVLNIKPIDASANEILVEQQLPLLRGKLQSAQITSYTYIPHVGVKTVTDPSGKMVSYDYDEFGRLKSEADTDGNIVKQYTTVTDCNYHARPEWEAARRQAWKEILSNLEIKGIPYLMLGRPQTVSFGLKRCPYSYRWRMEWSEQRNNVTYELGDNSITLYRIDDGIYYPRATTLELYLDFMDENGEWFASTRPLNIQVS